MMNENEHGDSMRRIRAWFWDVLREFSRRDYLAAGNPKYSKKTGQRIHIPYASGIDTTEAMDHYKMAIMPEWTNEEEERIKAYRLKTMPRIDPKQAPDNPWR